LVLFEIVLYNQPKICPNATWNVNGATFANSSVVGTRPHGFFIDISDTIYYANYDQNQIFVWSSGTTSLVRSLTVKLYVYATLFVTMNRDVYFENGNYTGRIDKWSMNTTSSVFVTNFGGSCDGLFIDINNTVYCSMRTNHQVVAISFSSPGSSTTIAGNGSYGSASNQLHKPWGIFVDISFNLYVADAGNNRVQLFRPGQLNGTTVAGNGIPNNLTLNLPTDVILDGDGYLFIADNVNNRIIRSGPTDFQCVAGCSGSNGSAPYQLYKPYAMRLDSAGNIYVADEFNSRMQKFTLATNTCGKFKLTNRTVRMTIKYICHH
jgi:hypothetical protein